MSTSQQPPFQPQEQPPFNPQQPPPVFRQQNQAGTPGWVWAIAGIGGGCGCLTVGVIAFFVAFGLMMGSSVPDITVTHGGQLSQTFVDTIDETGVLEPGEKIQYMYSDALFDLRDGFYLLTDRKVVVYNRSWAEPAILVPFDQILGIRVHYSDTFLEDSMVYLQREDDEVPFPLSTENGGDHVFIDALEREVQAVGGPAVEEMN